MKAPQPEYVVGFAFSEDRKRVLLIEKIKPAWMKGLLNGIGGKIEKNETAVVAMHREAVEEAKLDLEWRPVFLLMAANIHHGMPDAQIYVFSAFTDIDKAETMTEERLHIIPVEDLNPAEMVSNLRWIIPMCLHGNIAGFPIIRERAAA